MQAIEKLEACLPADATARALVLGEAVRLPALIAHWPESASYLELLGPATPPPGTLDEARRQVTRRATALPLAAFLSRRGPGRGQQAGAGPERHEPSGGAAGDRGLG